MNIQRRAFLQPVVVRLLGSRFRCRRERSLTHLGPSASWSDSRPEDPLDIAARTVAPLLSEPLRPEFIVENRPGASGNIATSEVCQGHPRRPHPAPVRSRERHQCDPVREPDFDFSRDIAPSRGSLSVPLVVEVNPVRAGAVRPRTAGLRAGNPGRLRVAFRGGRTPQHIAIELFQLMAGVVVTPVPYAGLRTRACRPAAGRGGRHVRPGALLDAAHQGRALGAARDDRADALGDAARRARLERVRSRLRRQVRGLASAHPADTPGGIVDLLNAAVNEALPIRRSGLGFGSWAQR